MQHPNRYYGVPDPDVDKPVYVWGHVTTMLKDGGGWNGENLKASNRWEREDTPLGKRWRLKKPKPSDPDPSRSNPTWTGQIIARMRKAGFSLRQVDLALSDPNHVGGEWLRGQPAYDDILHDWYDNSPGSTPLPLTTKDGGEAVSRGSTEKVWRQDSTGFTFWRRHTMDLVRYLAQRPRTMSEVQESGVVHYTVIRRYVDALEDAGIIKIATEDKFLCRDGKRRAARVVRVATPEGVEAALSDEQTPEGDRPLWAALPRPRRAYEPVPEAAETRRYSAEVSNDWWDDLLAGLD